VHRCRHGEHRRVGLALDGLCAAELQELACSSPLTGTHDDETRLERAEALGDAGRDAPARERRLDRNAEFLPQTCGRDMEPGARRALRPRVAEPREDVDKMQRRLRLLGQRRRAPLH
jgi:hypothetical protein